MTVSGTCFIEPMNKVAICLRRYLPTWHNELRAHNNDQIWISVIRNHRVYCKHTGDKGSLCYTKLKINGQELVSAIKFGIDFGVKFFIDQFFHQIQT